MPGGGHDRGEGGRRARRQWRARVQAARADLGTTLVEALAWAGDRFTEWRQVPDFGGSGSDGQHYVVRHGDHGATVVEFGDGVHGHRRRPAAASPCATALGLGTGPFSCSMVG